MEINKLTLADEAYPSRLRTISSPPKQLYVSGTPLAGLLERPCVAIVGSRKVTPYGREMTAQLARELAQHGVVIISGLAFGVDSIAHQATLDAGGQTIAVLPSPLESIYPASHRPLARRIVEQGGALVTEFPAGTESFRGNFVARNRIIAGLSRAVLITEAALKSGSLHTARFGLNAGRDILAVPGNITSPTSQGTNNLIKIGATPVTSVDDILHVLHIASAAAAKPVAASPAERAILGALQTGIVDGAELQARSGLGIEEFNQTLTMLEIQGTVRALGLNRWSL